MRRAPFILHVISLALACLLCIPAIAYADPTITSAKLYEGVPKSDDSNLVANLKDDSVTPSLVGSSPTEYYLDIQVTKGSENEDAWVSVTLPWYLQYNNVPGDISNLVSGGSYPRSFSHTSLDQILSYSNASGASSALTTKAGTICYHIKSDDTSTATVAGFQVSFKTVPNYHNTDTSQAWTQDGNQISVSCGTISNSTLSSATDTVSTDDIYETNSSGNGGFITYGNAVVPTCSVTRDTNNSSAYFTSSRMVWTGYFDYSSVFTTVEFDATYPAGMVVSSITYDGLTAEASGSPTTADGMTTQHYTVSASSGRLDDGHLITATACFPSDTFDANAGQQTMKISNFEADTWGDENSYLKTGSTELAWNLADGPAALGSDDTDFWRYDWYSREGIEQSTLIAAGNVWVSNSGNVASKTVTIKPGTGLIVRQIVVPQFTNAGDSITVTNAAGEARTYNLADVATTTTYTESGNGHEWKYSVIDVSKLTNVTDGKIQSITYTIGSMSTGDKTLGFVDDRAGDPPDQYYATRLALYGSDSTTANQTTSFEFTDTGVQDSSSQTVTSTFHNQSTKKVLLDAQNYTMSDTSLTAGESATVSFDIQANSYATLLGQTTCWDEDMALFAVVPSGFEISDLTVGGTAVTPEDVTKIPLSSATRRPMARRSIATTCRAASWATTTPTARRQARCMSPTRSRRRRPWARPPITSGTSCSWGMASSLMAASPMCRAPISTMAPRTLSRIPIRSTTPPIRSNPSARSSRCRRTRPCR